MVEDFKKRLETLRSQGVEFVKYHVTDLQGNIRESSLTIDEIKGTGTTTTDGSSLFGKIIPPTESDMLLEPDHSTLVRIPWMSDSARVLCNSYHPPVREGVAPVAFEGCPRSILTRVETSMDRLVRDYLGDEFNGKKIKKVHAYFAPELEFILLDKNYDSANIHRDSNLRNDNYFMPPKEEVDEALKEIIKSFSAMGYKKEKYHTEVTTLQCEIGVGHTDVLSMADAAVTLKHVIEHVAQRRGWTASFIPKFRQGVNGSGMHVHQNLAVTLEGEEKSHNLFYDKKRKDGLSDLGRHYIAGLLQHAHEITAITNPVPISYKRLVPGCEAPTYIAWDWLNRTALCRGHSKGTQKIRVEYRSPDPTANPYIAFAAMLSAGLEGISQELKLPPPENRDFYHDHKGVRELPGSLDESLKNMNESTMLRKRLGDFLVDTLYKLGKNLSSDYKQEVSDVDIRRFL